MLERVKKEYIEKTYNILEWKDHEDFLGQYAKKTGKLLKVIVGIGLDVTLQSFMSKFF